MANPIISKGDLTIHQICERMPKIELHAHLNGSISDSIIQKLKRHPDLVKDQLGEDCPEKKRKLDEDDAPHSNADDTVRLDGERSLSECWKSFSKIHEVIRSPNILFRATCAVIEEFVKDNVIYLELRTTPKKVHDISSKQVYIDTVIKAIKYCTRDNKFPITVKLLISIDRGNSAKNYLENVCLAQWYRILHPEIVVGLDLCGDPNKGDTKQILFALNFAKKLNLRVCIHLPEIKNEDEAEMFLKYGACRLAHGQYLHPSTGGNSKLWKILQDSGICMEACITSNLVTGVCPRLEGHYVKLLHDDGIPFIIGTDDCGVFNSSLSQEYKKFLRLVPLSKLELKCLSIRTVSHIFGNDVEKSKLKTQTEAWWNEYV